MHRLARLLRDKVRMMRDDALAVAHVVEEAFRGEDELNDEFLDSELRSMFYQLQDEGVMDIRRTEYKLDGRDRRAYFWRLREDEVVPMRGHGVLPRDHTSRIYHRLEDQAWARRRPFDDHLVDESDHRGPRGPA